MGGGCWLIGGGGGMGLWFEGLEVLWRGRKGLSRGR